MLFSVVRNVISVSKPLTKVTSFLMFFRHASVGDREGEITGSGIENKILTFYQSLLGNHFNGRKKFLFLMKYLSASVVEGWISQLRTIAREKEQSTYLPNNTF